MKVFFLSLSFFWCVASAFGKPLNSLEYFNTKLGYLNVFNSIEKKSYNGSLNYLEKGSCSLKDQKNCSCLVFFHGMGENPNSWTRLLKESWPKNYRVLAPHVPEFEEVVIKGVQKSFSSIAVKIQNFLDQSCSSYVVVSNSMGSWLHLYLMLQAPKKLKKNILLNPAGLQADYSKVVNILNSAQAQDFKSLNDLSYFEVPWVPSFVWNQIESFVWKRRTLKKIIHNNQIPYLLKTEDVKKIKSPVTIFWGEADRLLPKSIALDLQKSIKNSKLFNLKDCGHLAQKECPEKILPYIEKALLVH